jgi:hypothetical protein
MCCNVEDVGSAAHLTRAKDGERLIMVSIWSSQSPGGERCLTAQC